MTLSQQARDPIVSRRRRKLALTKKVGGLDTTENTRRIVEKYLRESRH